MQGATHALSDHVQKTRRLTGDQHIAFAENVTVDKRRPEVLRAALMRGVGVEFDAVFFLEVAHDVFVFRVEIITGLEAHADNLLTVARVAPSVMPELRIEPEMEILVIERALDDVVELLADKKPRDLLRVIGIQRAYDRRTGAVCANDVARAVDHILAVLARRDDDMTVMLLQPDKRGLVVHLRAAAFDRPMVGILAVQVRRGAAEKIHAQRNHAGKVKRHAATPGRFVQHFTRQRAEIFYQKAVSSRRQNAAAYFVARQGLALEYDRLKAGVNEALGSSRSRETRPDDDDICGSHGFPCRLRPRAARRAAPACR